MDLTLGEYIDRALQRFNGGLNWCQAAMQDNSTYETSWCSLGSLQAEALVLSNIPPEMNPTYGNTMRRLGMFTTHSSTEGRVLYRQAIPKIAAEIREQYPDMKHTTSVTDEDLVMSFNDTYSYEEVERVFQKVIANN